MQHRELIMDNKITRNPNDFAKNDEYFPAWHSHSQITTRIWKNDIASIKSPHISINKWGTAHPQIRQITTNQRHKTKNPHLKLRQSQLGK